ncbi:MAG: hydroxymethylbilane synthase [Salinibacterium sp.]|nr:hydroxymethylbilane synthase [Salinibacterium sp.]
MSTALRIGTRGSALALAQSNSMASALTAKTGVQTEIVPISTVGDVSTESLASLGGTGVFASALREALKDGRCDVVVHSLKDLPTAPEPGLVIAAVPKRVDARDALCARDELTLDTLPQGARVGTGSPRRVAQLLARRPDLSVIDIRGNVDTRLRKVTDGELDAVVLAAAGLTRLGRLEAITEFLGLDGWPTAPGQGALALEVRAGDETLVKALEHATSRIIVDAERQVLALLEAGCSAPVGAHGVVDDGMLFLSARVYSADGAERLTSSHALFVSDTKHPAGDVAARVAEELFDLGAAALMGAS